MALFKKGGGAGGNKGKGTKPAGGYGAGGMPADKTGLNNKQSTQPAQGSKPGGKYGSAGTPQSTKPKGGYGAHSGPGSKNANAASVLPSSYYKDREGYPFPVPKGQGPGENGIPNGKKP